MALPSPSFYNVKEPDDPCIYDILNSNLDDPSVVRYAENGQITAATPARLVAQITSKEFMDYELVSDFFLTVRAYLSTEDLLALLLSRLRWAINRFEEDGRIIRIRTFAALRHWILNYFRDDFEPHLILRVQFCDKINSLYHDVKARNNGGNSDLKILMDLKRCWNGRCAMCYDMPTSMANSFPDDDILPGGPEREAVRSSEPADFPEDIPSLPVTFKSTDQQDLSVGIRTSWFGSPPTIAPSTVHQQHQSTNSADLPISPVSEHSIQVISCSIPTQSLRRNGPASLRPRGPHPIPVSPTTAAQIGPPLAMSTLGSRRPMHQHKRSGSFSDSFRDDRAPLPAATLPVTDRLQHNPVSFASNGSLIRGQQFLPDHPFVNFLAPTTPTQQLPAFDLSSGDVASLVDSTIGVTGSGQVQPAAKTLFSSIRRALSSSKHSSGPASLGSVSDTAASRPSRPKVSTLPVNVTYQTEANRERRIATGYKAPTRIDLLCANISETHKRLNANTEQSDQPRIQSIGIASGNEREQPSPFDQLALASNASRSSRKMTSGVTDGSKSIVIVDDTGFDPPIMSGAIPYAMTLDTSSLDRASGEHHPASSPQLSVRPNELSRDPSIGKRSQKVLPFSTIDIDGEDIVPHAARRTRVRSESSHFSPARSFCSRKHSSSRQLPLRKSASHETGVYSLSKSESVDGPALASVSPSFDEHGMPPHRRLPARALRRRPGGDLKAFQNVHDLEPQVRPNSVSSITTASDSIGGSMLYMSRNKAVAGLRRASASSILEEAAPKRVSMIRTHSSQPRLRPSFEAAVAGFSAIPDDDDGGLESTLAKLEGKYLKISPELAAETMDDSQRIPRISAETRDLHENIEAYHNAIASIDDPNRNRAALSAGLSFIDSMNEPTAADPASAGPSDHSFLSTHRYTSLRSGVPRASSMPSQESYGSLPLLERESPNVSRQWKNSIHDRSPNWSEVSEPHPLFGSSANQDRRKGDLEHSSSGVVEDTTNSKRIPRWSKLPMPVKSPAADSFLLDEEENLSDLSSDLSVETFEQKDKPVPVVRHYDSEHRARKDASRISQGHPPPSPPMTNEIALSVGSRSNPTLVQPRPLTPESSPRSRHTIFGKPQGSEEKQPPADKVLTIKHSRQPIGRKVPSSGHIPFILACDSETLAQQMTLVEKSALNEIDWKDLVEMRWHKQPTTVLNWMEYLMENDVQGINLATARFNIMVKWALSEIVMTKNIDERALTIMKYIHIASFCRQLHNYATMVQLTISLTSIDCTRLVKTWEKVPLAEKKALKEMEALVQPIKNFHDLRLEMESANLVDGCIPFVGLYVHDLTYNAQKPSQIASTRDNDPLVNFERFRRTATIVKSLLRLIDASAKYNFQPVEGPIQRCLWVSALSDDKIRALSKELE